MKSNFEADPSRQTINETRWTIGAKLALTAAAIFLLLNIAQVAYRFTIPSLGWTSKDPDTEEVTYEFRLEVNAVEASSPLQPGDAVQSIGGIPVSQIITPVPTPHIRPEFWQIGEKVLIAINRAGQPLEYEIQLIHWTHGAWWLTNFGGFNALLNWLITMLLFGVGTFTFFKRPGNLSARFLFAFGLASLSITLSDSTSDYIALYLDFPAAFTKGFFSNIVFAYLLAPSLLSFTLTFPRPKPMIERQPLLLLVPYLVGSITIILLILAPEYATIGFLLTFAMLLLGLVALVHTLFTMRDAISRAQMRWAVGGVTLGIAVFLLNFASNIPSPYREIVLSIASLGLPIITISLAIAILRYRLFDIDLIIRRTLQYALLTGMLVLAYLGSVVLLQSLFEALTGGQSQVVIVLSTLVIAALFNPLRRRVQRFIDRRFFRRKYDAEQILSNFSKLARDEVDMEKLSTALLAAVNETMQPEKVSLWLKPAAHRWKKATVTGFQSNRND
jgi:hypothetical protein